MKWIDAKTPPRKEGAYLVYLTIISAYEELGCSNSGYYLKKENKWITPENFSEYITHWMEYPRPPNKQLKDNGHTQMSNPKKKCQACKQSFVAKKEKQKFCSLDCYSYSRKPIAKKEILSANRKWLERKENPNKGRKSVKKGTHE